MNLESVREYCLTLPHATEKVQWVDHLLFKVGGKMFAVMALEPQDVVLSFKATPDQFFELQEMEGVKPAPYMARAQWLALERFDVLRDDELKQLLTTSHRLIHEKLPRWVKEILASGKTVRRSPAATKKPRRLRSWPRNRNRRPARGFDSHSSPALASTPSSFSP